MVLLGEPTGRAYLEKTDLLPSLEIGIEEMLRACTEGESRRNPVTFLAEWLKRHNPRHNPAIASRVKEMREAAVVAAAERARLQAETDATAETSDGMTIVGDSSQVTLSYQGGQVALSIRHRAPGIAPISEGRADAAPPDFSALIKRGMVVPDEASKPHELGKYHNHVTGRFRGYKDEVAWEKWYHDNQKKMGTLKDWDMIDLETEGAAPDPDWMFPHGKIGDYGVDMGKLHPVVQKLQHLKLWLQRK